MGTVLNSVDSLVSHWSWRVVVGWSKITSFCMSDLQHCVSFNLHADSQCAVDPLLADCLRLVGRQYSNPTFVITIAITLVGHWLGVSATLGMWYLALKWQDKRQHLPDTSLFSYVTKTLTRLMTRFGRLSASRVNVSNTVPRGMYCWVMY